MAFKHFLRFNTIIFFDCNKYFSSCNRIILTIHSQIFYFILVREKSKDYQMYFWLYNHCLLFSVYSINITKFLLCNALLFYLHIDSSIIYVNLYKLDLLIKFQVFYTYRFSSKSVKYNLNSDEIISFALSKYQFISPKCHLLVCVCMRKRYLLMIGCVYICIELLYCVSSLHQHISFVQTRIYSFNQFLLCPKG